MKKKILLLSTFLLLPLVLSGCSDQVKEKENIKDDTNNVIQEEGEESAENEESEQSSNKEEDAQVSVSSILERAKSIDSSKYDVVTILPSGEEREITVWWKGSKMRAETTIEMAGQELDGVYLLDREEEKSYAYIPAQNRAVSMDYSTTKEEVGDSPKSQSSEIQTKDFEILREEVWDNKDCVVIEYPLQDTNVARAWIWKEYGLPVRFVNDTSEGEVITEIRNIDFTDISDSKLELPDGVQVISLPTGISY